MAMGFDLGPRYTKESDAVLAQKAKVAKKATTRIKGSSNDIIQRIAMIKGLINQVFSDSLDKYEIIRDEAELINYFNKVIEVGEVSLDTETTSLDPITTTIAGFSMYLPNHPAVYVPLNHTSYVTGLKVQDQLDPEFVKGQFSRLVENKVKFIFHNAKFDIRVIFNQVGIRLKPYWDTMVAAGILNENEPKGLKPLWDKYCNSGESKGKVSYDNLFDGIPFTVVPITTGYIYAARDAEITYELYQFQKQFLDGDCDINYKNLSNVYKKVEMPMISVLGGMEDRGITIDLKFGLELSEKYAIRLKEAEANFLTLLGSYQEKIQSFRFRNPNIKLDDPINVGSPIQISTLLYDILELTSPERREPRGTGEAILKKLNLPITNAVLEYRGIAKLLSTYINKLPYEVKDKTGRLHGSYNQVTTVTGRLASSDPNLQNIPSRKGKEIRRMFVPKPGYVFVSGDFSQQEPRILAYCSQDENMIQAYRDNKDIYAFMASITYRVPYDDCLEFRIDGTVNPEGKKRRASLKAITLGITYGKGVAAMAEDMGISVKEAQVIYDSFFKSFPKVKKFIEETQDKARRLGYVEMLMGRKRRLPDMQLPKYEFSLIGNKPRNFDPLFDGDDSDISFEIEQGRKDYYSKLLDKTFSHRDRATIRESARVEGIGIKENSITIADAERQCVNSVIQGSAAIITKLAMIAIEDDPLLKEWDYKMLLSVHDEISGECPYEYRNEVKERICKLMIEAAADICGVPMTVDPCIEVAWTYELNNELLEDLRQAKQRLNSNELVSKEFHINNELLDKILIS